MIILKSNSMKIWESIFLNVYVLGKYEQGNHWEKKLYSIFCFE